MSILSSTRMGARSIRVTKQDFYSRGFTNVGKETDPDKVIRLTYKGNWTTRTVTVKHVKDEKGEWVDAFEWNSLPIDNYIKIDLLVKMWESKLQKSVMKYRKRLYKECGKEYHTRSWYKEQDKLRKKEEKKNWEMKHGMFPVQTL